jgi:prepilin-type N-terminal cleavage/methylation domain-containing protein
MKQKGFTLIELLVSMGIIAVLSGMAVFNFNQARMRARDVQRKSDLSQLQKALELYKNDNNGIYPALPFSQKTVLVDGGYSKIVFADPKATGWEDYVYTPGVLNKTYTITACLENKTDNTRVIPSVPCSSTGVIYQITNP